MLAEIEEKYEVLEKISEGGMGTVYKVRHRLLDEVRVIKVIRRELQSQEELQRRFTHEARTAIRLRHPHIAQLYDFAIAENGSPFMVMEFVDGLPLDDFLQHQGPLPLALALEIARQSLEAIGYLHSQGIVHRDISLDNLMLGRASDGQPLVKLIDLGIAKSIESTADNLTATGMFVGKARYSSPEQFQGVEIDHRSDLYSFGVALYQLLTGRVPFEGRSLSELLAAHLFREPTAFDESDPEGRVPEGLRRIVLRSLAKKPDERVASAKEFARCLAEVSRSFPLTEDIVRQVFGARPSPSDAPPHVKGLPHSVTQISETATVVAEAPTSVPKLPPPPPPPEPPDETGDVTRLVPELPPPEPSPEPPPPSKAGGVTLLGGLSELEASVPESGHTVLFRPEMEAVLASANDHLVEKWLRMQNSERIGSMLSAETSARLLLTGYGSFGGTSLVRGVTAKLMQNVARRRRGKVLVVRLETPRAAQAGSYELFVNEKRAGLIDDLMEEARLAPIVAETLAEPEPSGARVGVTVAARHDTFQGLTSVFDHGSGKGRTSARAEAVASVVFQLMMLLEGSHDDAVLGRAFDEVLADDPKGGTQQLILVVDRVDHDDAVARLLDSELHSSRRRPRLSMILVARREAFDRWPDDLRRRLDLQGFRECYVRRLWEQDLDLGRELGHIMEIRDTGDEEQRRRLETWLAHLAYEAQGSIALALRKMKSGRDWTRLDGGLVLDPSTPFIRDREEIEHNAHVQTILIESWPEVAGSLFNTAARADQARIGAYHVVNWIRDNPIFRRDSLLEAAATLPLPISYDREVREATLDRLLAVLEANGYVKARDAGRYEVCWRRTPAPASVRAAPGPELPPSGDRPRQVALLVDPDGGEDANDALAIQIAFEVIEAGWRLVVTDRPGLEAAIRERLSTCHRFSGDDEAIRAEPICVLAYGSDVRRLAGEEVVRVAAPERWIEALLERADAVIFLRRDDRSDLARIRGELSGGRIRMIPVGVAGGLAETLWSEVQGGRVESLIPPQALASLRPGVPSSVPEIARAAVTLAGEYRSTETVGRSWAH